MVKMTFKEYYDSKEILREAAASVPRINSEYEMTRYCQFPILAEDDDKEYLSLKPKDRINILWEYLRTDDTPFPVKVEIVSDEDTQRVFPCWGKSKLLTWIQKNTVKNK